METRGPIAGGSGRKRQGKSGLPFSSGNAGGRAGSGRAGPSPPLQDRPPAGAGCGTAAGRGGGRAGGGMRRQVPPPARGPRPAPRSNAASGGGAAAPPGRARGAGEGEETAAAAGRAGGAAGSSWELEANQVLQNSGKLDLQVPVSHKAWIEVLTAVEKSRKMTVMDQDAIK
nr:translation initiation factor IF-2-like [Taeniopygia guttata]